MNEYFQFVANNGVAVFILIYFIVNNKKQLEKQNEILTEIKTAVINCPRK